MNAPITPVQKFNQQAREILTHQSLIKVSIRAKTKEGDKPQEVDLVPWKQFGLDASDRTIADLTNLALILAEEICREVIKADGLNLNKDKLLKNYQLTRLTELMKEMRNVS